MNSKRTRIMSFIVFVLLFAAGFIWWMFHLPYSEAILYRAIPHNADMVTTHLDLPERLLHNATNETAINTIPPIAELLKIIRTSGALSKAITSSELKGKRTVIAYVHRSGSLNQPAWFFATWLGVHGQVLRWSLLWKTPPELTRMSTDSGYPMWAIKSTALNEPVLSFAFVNGMLIGCVSREPAGVRRALETYDGQVPSVEAAKVPEYVAPLIPDPMAPDTGWFRMPTRPVPGMPHIVAFSFDSIEAPCIRGAFQSDMPLATNSPLNTQANLTGLADRIGNAPSAVLVMPADLLTAALENAPYSLPIAVASTLLQSGAIAQSNSPIVAGLFLGDFGGRIKLSFGRPRIPALSLAIRLGNRERVREAFTRAADLVNVAYRIGLIVTPARILPDKSPLYGIEMTSSNAALMLGTDDLPACAMVDNWLVLSSHAKSLQTVLSQSGTNANVNITISSELPEWQCLLQKKQTGAFFWADLEATGKELETLLTFAQLGASMNMGKDFSSEIALSRKIIKKARTFKTGSAWIELVNNKPRLCLEIGQADTPARGRQ